MHRIAVFALALALWGLAPIAGAETLYEGRFEAAFHSLLGRPAVSGGWKMSATPRGASPSRWARTSSRARDPT